MNSVLILGGYGGFGARLAWRLAQDGWHIIVAGRNGDKARRFAATLPDAIGIAADRNGDLEPFLTRHRPFLLIDAAGPFQSSGTGVIDACIAQRIHYLDLADARGFVAAVPLLDDRARAAGIAVVSGASSVPALSGAAARLLAQDMEVVHAIAISISASSRATAGASVAAAILSYVGHPVPLWRGRQWVNQPGWSMLARERYVVPGERPLRRTVALADVPDLALFPAMFPGRPATVFRAGPEFSFQTWLLWLLSWPVRWGWWRSLAFLGRWIGPVQRLGAMVGTDRSAMMVEVKGIPQTGPMVERWTLIANEGHGPEIPTLAVQLLARALREGRLTPGARHAGGLLTMEDFRSLFPGMAIREARTSTPYTPLYQRVMGSDFNTLPTPVRAMHQIVGDGGASGSALVDRGSSPLARLIAAIMRFPPAGQHALRVRFEEREGRERWTRHFGRHRFSSELRQRGAQLIERFGPMRFRFDLAPTADGLEMVMRGWSVCHIPLPLALAPRSHAREWAEGDDFCFDVPIALPIIGRIVHYRGRLRPG